MEVHAAAVVGPPGHPGGELLRPVPGEHQVGVRVDEAGQHARTSGVDATVCDRAGRPDSDDHVVGNDDTGVLDYAE